MFNRNSSYQSYRGPAPKLQSLRFETSELTFEEGFRLITQQLNLSDLEVQMNLHNPLVQQLVQKIMATQKMRTQMAEFFAEKFEALET